MVILRHSTDNELNSTPEVHTELLLSKWNEKPSDIYRKQ